MEGFLSEQSKLIILAVLVGGLLLYLIPSIIAVVRRHLNALPIILVNILLGWTVLGWLWALIWSFTSHTRGNERRRGG